MEPQPEPVRSSCHFPWGIAVLLFGLTLSGWLAATEPVGSDPLSRAREALAQGDLAEASKLVDGASEDVAAQLDWRLLHAELHAARGQLLEALTQAAAIVRDHPADPRGRLLEARWLSHLGRLRSAQERYEELLEEHPEDRDLQSLLALTFAWRGDWEAARRRLESVFAEEPHHELAFLAHLRVLLATGHASAAWQRARKHDAETGQEDPELGLFMARLAARVGAIDLAHSLASRATADPDLLQRQRAFRAVQLIRAGDSEAGGELLKELRQHRPATFDTLMEAANAHATVDQLPMARDLYEQALALTPERPEAHLGLARLASREGRLAGSLALYQRVTQQNPEAIEGWLGIAHMARLLNHPALLASALESAWLCAPRSGFLHQETIQLALLDGDVARFAEALDQYLEDQPHDRNAQLWALRQRRAQGERNLDRHASALLDPFEPDLASQALLFLPAVEADPATLVASLPDVAEPGLQSAVRLALAQRLAVSLRRELAVEVARGVSPEAERWVDVLGSAWWAYLSAPLANEPLLASGFDPQARTLWLVNQIERRLRTLAIETESRVQDEWLLQRAHWFAQWRDRWASLEAGADLRMRLLNLVPDWGDTLQPARIEDAWRQSEQALSASFETTPHLLARARWRHDRFDYASALDLLRQVHARDPTSAEPVLAQIEILRASGRWFEALAWLRQLTQTEPCPPLLRLQSVEILRRTGQFSEAARELTILAAEGFDEPEYYRQQALLAQAAARFDQAGQWLTTGLTEHPDVPDLIRFHADELRRAGKLAELARLMECPRAAAWITPERLADAWPHLAADHRDRILRSAAWWFHWQWLPWERLEKRSLDTLDAASRTAAATGRFDDSLQHLLPALEAAIPDSDLWLKAGRLFDLEGRALDSARAYQYAALLGVGRPDALSSELSQLASQRPIDAAQEFARRLDLQPDDPALRKGLVLALLRAGQITAADRALAPLLESLPDDAEVVLLAAQVRGAMARVRQARSLYGSLLRDDPLHPDAHAGRLALRDIGEWGAAVAYEYAVLRDRSGSGTDPADWQEAQLSLFWRRPARQTWGLDYRWVERQQQRAQEIVLNAAQGWNRDWILRLHAGAALNGEMLPAVRVGAGAHHRFTDKLFGGLDVRYLHYRDVDVLQFVPTATWRWHPRGTAEGRLYAAQNLFRDGPDKTSLTGLLQTSWRFAGNHSLVLHYAVGDDNSFDPVPGLIASDSFQSVGLHLRLAGPHGWTLHPAYRFERHERFQLHAVGAALAVRF
jgi:YaiO family outer membrane protein